jgi:hypothetical protein
MCFILPPPPFPLIQILATPMRVYIYIYRYTPIDLCVQFILQVKQIISPVKKQRVKDQDVREERYGYRLLI